YDTISAWIKATRGSDPDASLYYLAVMLEGGEDPRFIVRRMVILASEDIGNADPQALVIAVATAPAAHDGGPPEPPPRPRPRRPAGARHPRRHRAGRRARRAARGRPRDGAVRGLPLARAEVQR